eukprot:TRINITY_DN952_c0_g1_i1.p1 TRINITY_DN952_c0_g1~~TRINITY_DN952_c0_g1_i1.p1  ORF type:complete len:607 (+),score=167.38 TRINITY_DN952_c0_g1_i1:67-1887(+)
MMQSKINVLSNQIIDETSTLKFILEISFNIYKFAYENPESLFVSETQDSMYETNLNLNIPPQILGYLINTHEDIELVKATYERINIGVSDWRLRDVEVELFSYFINPCFDINATIFFLEIWGRLYSFNKNFTGIEVEPQCLFLRNFFLTDETCSKLTNLVFNREQSLKIRKDFWKISEHCGSDDGSSVMSLVYFKLALDEFFSITNLSLSPISSLDSKDVVFTEDFRDTFLEIEKIMEGKNSLEVDTVNQSNQPYSLASVELDQCIDVLNEDGEIKEVKTFKHLSEVEQEFQEELRKTQSQMNFLYGEVRSLGEQFDKIQIRLMIGEQNSRSIKNEEIKEIDGDYSSLKSFLESAMFKNAVKNEVEQQVQILLDEKLNSLKNTNIDEVKTNFSSQLELLTKSTDKEFEKVWKFVKDNIYTLANRLNTFKTTVNDDINKIQSQLKDFSDIVLNNFETICSTLENHDKSVNDILEQRKRLDQELSEVVDLNAQLKKINSLKVEFDDAFTNIGKQLAEEKENIKISSISQFDLLMKHLESLKYDVDTIKNRLNEEILSKNKQVESPCFSSTSSIVTDDEQYLFKVDSLVSFENHKVETNCNFNNFDAVE